MPVWKHIQGSYGQRKSGERGTCQGKSGNVKEVQKMSEKFKDLSIFYRYFHGYCSQEIKNIIPDPVRRVRTTRSSTYSHPFQVTLPNPRTLAHKSSFIPRTSQLWNSLPPTTFPESYNLSSFKSNINKLDLISLSTSAFPFYQFFLCRGFVIGPTAFPRHYLLKQKGMSGNIREACTGQGKIAFSCCSSGQ